MKRTCELRAPRGSASALVWATWLAASAVAAQPLADPGDVPANPDSALAVALAALPGEPISLETALAQAVANDTALEIARAGLLAASGVERRERGAFAPELFGEAERAGDSQPTASFFSGADVLETESTRLGAGARVRLPLGTELSASLNAVRLESNSAFATLSPQIDSYGELELVQPLLKGFGPGARGERDAAALEREGAEAGYEEARLATRADVELIYWALHAAERDYAVQRLIRDQAIRFLEEVRLRARAGLVGPAEEANARVFLADQEQQVLDGEEVLDSLSDRLVTLIGRRPAGGAPRFRPADSPPADQPAIDLDRLLALTLERSPRIAAAERRLAAARARLAGATWNARPQLDLVGNLGGRGLAGTGQDVILDFGGGPDTLRTDLNTGYSDGFKQVFKRDFPTWAVGLRFSVPIGGGGDAGERDRLAAEVVFAEQELEALRRALVEDVRARHRELARSRNRLEFAARGVDASYEQVRIGTLQFRSGRTTAFELVRLGADFADAQRRYSGALVRTARATADLRRLTAGAYPGLDLAPPPSKESRP
ncbi:MAG TPA: TolC family protein [Candidatus Krumholzibacteria bacterium]|nr:TolC family protein [Candidatus Krumholzibacteria bacterium]HPD72614.1 TolC family protein [Candidatus Krumholzibacteria bacterium]HRY40454.1 TolC family protein [Candidatus Krumholzibacteria bacterium]